MALHNISSDHAASSPTDGDNVTIKVPKSMLYVLLAVAVLAGAYVVGSTLKERVTDPVIDKSVETVESVANDIAAIPEEAEESIAKEYAARRIEEMYGQKISEAHFNLLTESEFMERQNGNAIMAEVNKTADLGTVYIFDFSDTLLKDGKKIYGAIIVWQEQGQWHSLL